jgi:hypothetical protein
MISYKPHPNIQLSVILYRECPLSDMRDQRYLLVEAISPQDEEDCFGGKPPPRNDINNFG